MDESSGHEDRKRQKLKTAAILWGIAAALALIAFTGDTIETGRLRPLRAIVAGVFTLMAFVSYRRYRRP